MNVYKKSSKNETIVSPFQNYKKTVLSHVKSKIVKFEYMAYENKTNITKALYQKMCCSTVDILVVATCHILHLTLSWWRFLSYRNRSLDLLCKPMNWFLYGSNLRHENINGWRRGSLLRWQGIVSKFHLSQLIPIFPPQISEKH